VATGPAAIPHVRDRQPIPRTSGMEPSQAVDGAVDLASRRSGPRRPRTAWSEAVGAEQGRSSSSAQAIPQRTSRQPRGRPWTP